VKPFSASLHLYTISSARPPYGGKQKKADFLTKAAGICNSISNPPPKTFF
jgi:hypothetical protein